MTSELPIIGSERAADFQSLEEAAPPILEMNAYQEQAFWCKLGFYALLWARQKRKTTTLANIALKVMLEKPWNLVTYAAITLKVGGEMMLREGQVWRWALENMSKRAEAAGKRLSTNCDDGTFDDFLELLQLGKLEVKLWHDNTAYSRTSLVAADPATAKGYSGYVMVDECQDIPDLKLLLAEMDPIASARSDYRTLLAGTIAYDEAAYWHELIAQPVGTFFEPDPRGHWYESQAGVSVHRVDAWDAHLAGIKFFDKKTRREQTPDENRAAFYDKDGWDRAQALKVIADGTNAVSMAALQVAMEKGRGQCAFADVSDTNDFPVGWRSLLGGGRLAIGIDPATTEKKKSNPTSLTIMEQVGAEFAARLIVRWKTKDPQVARRLLAECVNVGHGRRVSVIVVDGSNERYFAADLRREYAGRIPVEIMVSAEGTEYLGESMSVKTYLGSALCHDFDEYKLWLPETEHIRQDMKLVIRSKGGFDNAVDGEGHHGDTFDSTKLARHGIVKRFGGTTEARAVSTSAFQRFFNRDGSPRDNNGVKLCV